MFEGGMSESLAIPWIPQSSGDYTLTLEIVKGSPETGQPLMDEENLLSNILTLHLTLLDDLTKPPEPESGALPIVLGGNYRKIWRRERDSNPRYRLPHTTA